VAVFTGEKKKVLSSKLLEAVKAKAPTLYLAVLSLKISLGSRSSRSKIAGRRQHCKQSTN